jgi:uncharacterized RmlC-like cupin family protein
MNSEKPSGVCVVRPGQTYTGKQGFQYGAGVSSHTTAATRMCMNVLPMPAGARARVHYHQGIETIAYLLEGACSVWHGAALEHRVQVLAGDQVFVPADIPHAPFNDSGAPCLWLVAHSSASDQDGIVLLPELDAVLAAR